MGRISLRIANLAWSDPNYSCSCESLTASFKYDAFGRRIEKTINDRTIKYFYDGADIVQEIEGGMVTASYLRTLYIDEHLARLTSNSSRFYQTDALGSVIALLDENGVMRTSYTYDAFGNVAVSGEASGNPFQYTGRENDGTGLYYYRARYYSPELHRFISEDPIRLPGGINFYAYVKNNPLINKDPTGLKAYCLITGDFSITGALAIGLMVGGFTYSCWDDCGNYRSGTSCYICSCLGLGLSGSVGAGFYTGTSIESVISGFQKTWVFSTPWAGAVIAPGSGGQVTGGLGAGGFYCECHVM